MRGAGNRQCGAGPVDTAACQPLGKRGTVGTHLLRAKTVQRPSGAWSAPPVTCKVKQALVESGDRRAVVAGLAAIRMHALSLLSCSSWCVALDGQAV